MAFQRRHFGGLSLEVPPGLFEDDEAPAGYAIALTALEPATLRLRMIDPAGAASLSDLMDNLAGAPPVEVSAAGESFLWPGLAALVPGEPRVVHYLFETAGQVVHGLAAAPNDLWADYGTFLEAAMLSLDPGGTPVPTLPLFPGQGLPDVREKPLEEDPAEARRRQLDEASGEALALILALRFDEAETLIRRLDADIYGANALARAYETALGRSPAEPSLFDRALHWARSAVPEPHTAIEAEQYATATEAREARLREIAGRRPTSLRSCRY